MLFLSFLFLDITFEGSFEGALVSREHTTRKKKKKKKKEKRKKKKEKRKKKKERDRHARVCYAFPVFLKGDFFRGTDCGGGSWSDSM